MAKAWDVYFASLLELLQDCLMSLCKLCCPSLQEVGGSFASDTSLFLSRHSRKLVCLNFLNGCPCKKLRNTMHSSGADLPLCFRDAGVSSGPLPELRSARSEYLYPIFQIRKFPALKSAPNTNLRGLLGAPVLVTKQHGQNVLLRSDLKLTRQSILIHNQTFLPGNRPK